ncbi:hypothetical protein BKA81DRAFT_362434 [Phyllosticta paracitricarpa]
MSSHRSPTLPTRHHSSSTPCPRLRRVPTHVKRRIMPPWFGQIRPVSEVPCSRVRQRASDKEQNHNTMQTTEESPSRDCAAATRNARSRTPSSSGTPLRMVRRPPAKQI